MNRRQAKKLRKAARQELRRSGLTPENIARQARDAALALATQALRPRPKFIPAKVWSWFVAKFVVDPVKMGVHPSSFRKILEEK